MMKTADTDAATAHLSMAELVEPHDPRWRAHLGTLRHDFYHLPEYASFAARHQEAGRPVAFVAAGDGWRFLLPLIIRSIPDSVGGDGRWHDATSPRGYPGPLLSIESRLGTDEVAARALGALSEYLAAKRIVSAFVRLHPLLPVSPAALRQYGTVVTHGTSVVIDLSPSPDEIWRGTRSNHRRHINRTKRLGHRVRFDAEWERLDGFMHVYAQSMDRLGAASHWRLSREYIVELRAALGERAHLCVAEDGDELCAAAILIETDGMVEYHLAGTADRYVGVSPTKAIIDFAWRWAKDRGDRLFHLAGSLKAGDSLNHFKVGFSALQFPVATWRLVSDASTYARLSGAWPASTDGPSEQTDAFFPAYRKPVARTVDHPARPRS